MKYGSSTTTAGTSNGNTSNNNGYEHNNSNSVINAGNGGQTMMFLPVEATNSGVQQSSVIKTAPPGRSQMLMDFSPKQEPIELAPLSNTHPCLQNLGKMSVGSTQLEHYYSSMNSVNNSSKNSYSPYYEYLNVGSAASATSSYPQSIQQQQSTNSLLQPTATSAVVALGYLNQLDNCGNSLIDQQQQRILLYKNNGNNNGDEVGGGVALLSPVDSGIGQELLLEQAKQNQSAQLQRVHESREQSIPVCIPKLDNQLGFQYTLEAPISTSIRKEDDRMTYVNKGQFYTVSFDYILDLRCPLKGMTVRSQIIIVFREDKSFEEELRTWLVWYKRQHSPKQRIIEIDAKNSMGAIGGNFDEIAHNAVQFCWTPGEQPGPKVSIAVQCLSTDFSTQKGVKGLPLHVQIDTYDDQSDSKIPFHRGYCQIKVFCDKGAERKLRDEDKRAHRRKNNGSNGSAGSAAPTVSGGASGGAGGGGGRKKIDSGEFHESCERSQFYHSADLERPAALFVPSDDFFFDTASICSYDALSEMEPQPKRPKSSERIMIYVRKADEDVFTPLHLVPPSLGGLARAISEKYNLDETKIEAFYKQCQKGGITVKIDDDMLRHYSNQDTFLIELKQSELDRHTFYAVTLIELLTANNDIPLNKNNKILNSFNIHHHHHQDTASATSSSSTNSDNISSNHQQQQRTSAAVW
uniref:Grh/CP2 DB domain-containing protein n=1 Tax=Meloidogyne javanica TaxID=6303 RepID=A0A915NCC5_MELJA